MINETEKVMNMIADLRKSGTEFCIATIVRTEDATSAKAGAKAVITTENEIIGFLGGNCVQGAIKQSAEEVLAEGKPRLIRVKPKDQVIEKIDVDGVELHKSSCPSGGTIDLFIEPMLSVPHLVVCGASPVASSLVELAACMGYRVTAAALPEDHPMAAEPEQNFEGFDLPALELGSNDFVVVSTQGKRDREALSAALRSDAGYVGFVGSHRKADVLKSQLKENGLTDAQIERLSAPAGLDIHAIEPVEIALSILSEIVSFRRKSIQQPTSTWQKISNQASKLVKLTEFDEDHPDTFPKCC